MSYLRLRSRWIVLILVLAAVAPLGAARRAVASGSVVRPSISVSDAWVKEGNAGTVNASFQVSLSNAPTSGSVSVQVATANGTAVAGSDYTALGATSLTWSTVDALTKTVTVPVIGDTAKESVETFLLKLSAPVDAVLADTQGTGTIVSEEAPFFVYARNASVTEGNAGTKAMTFTLALSVAPPAGQSATVKVATANGTAVASGDYTPVALTTKTFAAGVSSLSVNVTIKGDTGVEPNETLNLNLSSPSPNTVIGDAQGLGTIVNDDGTPGAAPKRSVYVTNASPLEGNAGTTATAFVVSLSSAPATGETVKVNVATTNATATAGSDYTALPATTLTYTAGQLSKTVSVNITGDARKEPTETFALALSAPVNAVLGDASGAATILDEEGPFFVFARDASVLEGDSGTTTLTFTLALASAPPAGQSVTVKIATADGTAASPGDYTAVPPSTKTFGAGVASMTVDILVDGDTTIEIDDTLALNLSMPSANAVIADAQGAGTILDDDGPLPPTVGAENAVGNTTYGPASQSQTASAVAWNGTEYLVVWEETRPSGSAYDIYGARVADDGTLLDQDPIAISTASSNQLDPSVAWDGTNFMVVWTDFRSAETSNVYAARVSSAGAVLDPLGVRVTNAVDSQYEAAIASNGTDSLVTWRDERAGFFVDDIYGARISSAGAVLNPGGIQIGSAANTQFEPAVAWNGTNYLVAWADDRAGTGYYDIYGTQVSSTGTVSSVSGTAISTASREQYAPAITSNGSDFYVAWHDHRSNVTYDLYGTRVSSAGSVLTPTGTAISTAALDQWNPAVAWNGTNYVVLWQVVDLSQQLSLQGDVYTARVSDLGVVLDAGGVVVSNAEYGQTVPAVASNGTDSFATWMDFRNLHFDIVGSRITNTGSAQDPLGILVTTGLAPQVAPAVASNGTDSLVAWQDYRSGQPTADIYAARIAADGTILDPEGIAISTVAGSDETSPAVAWDGTNYLVVWDDKRDADPYMKDIYGARVGTDGAVLDPGGFLISGALRNQESPSVAWNGQSYLVTFTDDRNVTRHQVTGALLDSTGQQTLIDIGIGSTAGDQIASTVASNGTDFLVAWSENGDILGSQVTGAGSVSSAMSISTAAGNQQSPSAAWNGSDYLVAWSDGRAGSATDIYAGMVDGTGVLVGDASTGIPISTAVNNQSAPATAADGSGFVVVWADGRAGAGDTDVYGARLSASGSLQDPAGFAVAASATAETAPAIAEGSGDHFGFYQRVSAEAPYNGLNRIWWRTITPG